MATILSAFDLFPPENGEIPQVFKQGLVRCVTCDICLAVEIGIDSHR